MSHSLFYISLVVARNVIMVVHNTGHFLTQLLVTVKVKPVQVFHVKVDLVLIDVATMASTAAIAKNAFRHLINVIMITTVAINRTKKTVPVKKPAYGNILPLMRMEVVMCGKLIHYL